MSIYTPYFYVIQDTRNGMYYAGSKWGKGANPEMFMVEGGYTTSSQIVNAIIQQCGLHTFVIRRIKPFRTRDDAFRYETRFLRKINARKNRTFYNAHNNDGMFNPDKMADYMFEKYGVAHYNQTNDARKRLSENNPFKGTKGFFSGKNHTSESKARIGAASKSRPKSEETRQKLSRSHVGKKHSRETREKISQLQKGVRVGENNSFFGKKHRDSSKEIMSSRKQGRFTVTNGVETKYIYTEESIPSGWWRGRHW
jgi:hypothetical protein